MGEILMAAERGAQAETCATAAEEQSTLRGRIGEVCGGTRKGGAAHSRASAGRFGCGFNQKYRYYSGIQSMVEDGPDENE